MILSNNIPKTQNFKGGLTPEILSRIKRIKPTQIEAKLSKDGIITNLGECQLLACLSNETAKLFKKLGLKLPPKIRALEFPSWDSAAANCYTRSKYDSDLGQRVRRFGIDFNSEVFDVRPEFYDVYCDKRTHLQGSNHILNTTIHECLHSDHFQRIASKFKSPKMPLPEVVKKYNDIPLGKFQDEIAEKIGIYGTLDPFELHSVYQAREICEALDDKLKLKYNPLTHPQIKLSPDLRKLVDSISACDFETANKIANS